MMQRTHYARTVMQISIGGFFIVFIVLTVFNALLTSTSFENLLLSNVSPIAESRIPNEREIVSDAVRGYLFGGIPIDSQILTERERSHMTDVKSLIVTERYLWYVTGIGLLILALLLRNTADISALRSSSAIGFIGMFFISIVVVAFFPFVFQRFHEVSFSNTLWLLDPEEHALIRTYPPDFFRFFAIAYVTFLLAAFGILYSIFRSVKK